VFSLPSSDLFLKLTFTPFPTPSEPCPILGLEPPSPLEDFVQVGPSFFLPFSSLFPSSLKPPQHHATFLRNCLQSFTLLRVNFLFTPPDLFSPPGSFSSCLCQPRRSQSRYRSGDLNELPLPVNFCDFPCPHPLSSLPSF